MVRMNVAIVGYATEGTVSARYYAALGHTITICDRNANTEVPNTYHAQLGENYLDNLGRFDVIVRSAGVHPDLIIRQNPDVASKITSAVDEFLDKVASKNIIGITGTKGKGTTSTLTAKLLEAHGKKVWLGGNIGLSPLSFVHEVTPDDWVVLELSSFQLYDVKHSPQIGVCLMVVPEHLDWHTDFDDYVTAKSQMFRYQKRDDVAIYFAGNQTSKSIAESGDGQPVPYFAKPGAIVCKHDKLEVGRNVICDSSDIKILGKHNWQNVCAAVTAAWQAGCQDTTKLKKVITSFSGLPHRLEYVATIDDVAFYDDSFGTTPETAIVAMQAFNQPKVMILGGSDKGASFSELAQAVVDNSVRHAVVVGATGPRIERELRALGFSAITTGPTTMPDMIDAARRHAHPGDVVLLSAGCASFGLFENYKQRGELFTTTVKSLASTG